MQPVRIARQIASLPFEAQKEVIDFVAFLKARHPTALRARKTRRIKLANEPFVGMWQDRKDMQDSAAWMRRLRNREWERRS